MFVRTRSSAPILLTALSLIGVSAAHAQENQTIAEVEIRGTVKTNIQVARAAAATVTKTDPGIKEGVPFRSDSFTAARQRIRDTGLYASVRGLTETTTDGRLRVIYEVVENPVVTQIVLTGNQSIPSKDILPKLQTQSGNVLNTATLDQDLLKIQNEYQSKGYRAFVTNEVGIDPKTGILTIPIQETIVEAIVVQGLKKTRPYVVTRAMKTQVGKPLNVNTMQKDIGRILDLGLFANVEVWRGDDGSELGKVKVVIPVQEQRTGQVGVSVGYSVRQRLTGTLSLGENNLSGRGQSVNASWTVGGATSANQFDLGFTEPYIDKHNTSLSADVYNRVSYRFNRSLSSSLTSGTNSDQYYEERRGGSVTISRPISDYTRVFTSLRAENVRANNLQANYNLLSAYDISQIRGSLVSRGSVQSVTLRSATNTRDNIQDPASGFYVSPAVEVGTGHYDYQDPRSNPAYVDDFTTPGINHALTTARTQNGAFNKLNLDLRSYFPLDGKKRAPENLRQPKVVFASRLLLGASAGNIGFSEQYFMGGADNLRGYADDRFWGNYSFLLSNELRVPLDKKSGTLVGALFADIGDAWGASDVNRENISGFGQHRNFSPQVGFGFGIRVKTPIGPVRLDYGIGQSNRTHFSIGQAF